MPPGAQCLLANLFALMGGLTYPWQQRRTTNAERTNYKFFADMLLYNCAGYFSYDQFAEGPTVLSDASKQRAYAGGGWCSNDGHYDYFKYGTAAARQPIDYLEGDTVICAIQRLAARWGGKWIPFGVDNQAFSKNRQLRAGPRLSDLTCC